MMNYDAVNANKIIISLQQKGLHPFVICGILANITKESGCNPKNVQNSFERTYGITDEEYTQRVDNNTYRHPVNGASFECDRVGYGLCQWTSQGRKNNLRTFAKYSYNNGQGVSIGNLQMQLEFMLLELGTGYNKVFTKMKACKNAYDVAVEMVCGYEKPASVLNADTKDKTCEERGQLAEEFYAKYFKEKEVTTPMSNKVLAISAGHYLYTPGKRIPKSLDPTETREWMLNARISDKLATILNRYEGIKILRLDDPTGEKGIAIENRVATANKAKVDFYLAIHHNALGRLFSGGGVTVFYYPTAQDRKNAQAMYDTLIAHNNLKGNRSQPLSTKRLYEVYESTAPALLVENGFMDSTTDEPIIITEEFAQKSAEGMAEFFVNLWGLQLKKDEAKSDILAEIESVKMNINALEKRLAELEAML